MKTVFFPEKGNTFISFSSKDACERYEQEEEEKEKRRMEYRSKFDPFLIKEELILNIEKGFTIPLGTIATCSHHSLSIKGMVRACQNFADQYEEYLNYY